MLWIVMTYNQCTTSAGLDPCKLNNSDGNCSRVKEACLMLHRWRLKRNISYLQRSHTYGRESANGLYL